MRVGSLRDVSSADLIEQLVLERPLIGPPEERGAATVLDREARAELLRRDDVVTALWQAIELPPGEGARELHRSIIRLRIAVRLLAALPPERGREALAALLGSPRSDVRGEACDALIRLATHDDGVWQVLLDPANDVKTLRASLNALVRRNALGAAEPLVLPLTERIETRDLATEALSFGGTTAWHALAALALSDPRMANPAVVTLVSLLKRGGDVAAAFEPIAAAIHAAAPEDGWDIVGAALVPLGSRRVTDEAFARGEGDIVYRSAKELASRIRTWIAAPLQRTASAKATPAHVSDVVVHGDAVLELTTRAPGTTGIFPLYAPHRSRALVETSEGRVLLRALSTEVHVAGVPRYRVCCWKYDARGEFNRIYPIDEVAAESTRMAPRFKVPAVLRPGWPVEQTGALSYLRAGRYVASLAELELRSDDGPPFSVLPWPGDDDDDHGEIDQPNALPHFVSQELATRDGPAEIALLPTRTAPDADPVALVWRIAEELASGSRSAPPGTTNRSRYYGALLQGSARLVNGPTRVLLLFPLAHAGERDRFLAFARAASSPPPLPLGTERLVFRAWRDDAHDLDLASELWGDARVTSLIGGPLDRREAHARLVRELGFERNHGVEYWPIFDRARDEHVGCAGLHPRDPATRVFELGFHLLPRHQGRGLATEAARSVIDWAFDVLGATSLFAGHHPDNSGSKAVLIKLGFHHTHDELYPPTGLEHPSYVLTRQDRAR